MIGAIIVIVLAIVGQGCGTAPTQTQAQSSVPIAAWVATPTPPALPADYYGATAQIEGTPNGLIVGDSISMGYTRFVYENLKDSLSMHHSIDNNRNSYYTNANFETWYQAWPNNQVIVWNNGIWDLTLPSWYSMYASDQPSAWYTTSDDEYTANLTSIAKQMTATGARVIFMTTTDVPAGGGGIWQLGRELDLNQIAINTLPQLGVEVYDLHAVALTITSMHDEPYDVHFTDAGNQILGNFVTQAILKQVQPIVGGSL